MATQCIKTDTGRIKIKMRVKVKVTLVAVYLMATDAILQAGSGLKNADTYSERLHFKF